MKKHSFDLEGHDFIPLNDLLKRLHLVGTGGEANVRISAGEAQVNGAPEIQKRKKIRAGDTVVFAGTTVKVH